MTIEFEATDMFGIFEASAHINNWRYRILTLGLLLLASSVGISIAVSTLLTLLILTGGLFAVLFFGKPWHILLFALLVRPILDAAIFPPFNSLGFEMGYGALLVLVTTILGLGYIFLHRIRFDRDSISLIYFTFLLLSLVSSVYSVVDLRTNLYELFGVLSPWVLYVLLVALIQRVEQIKVLVSVLITSTFVPLAVGLYQTFFRTGGVIAGGIYRVPGTFVWPNSYARFLAMAFIVIAVQLYTESRWRKMAYFGYLALTGMVLLATGARAAWIGLFAAVLVIGLIRKRQLPVAALLVALAVLPVLPPTNKYFISVSGRLSDLTTAGNTLIDRLYVWRVALAQYRNHPVFGAGWGYLSRVGLANVGRFGLPVHNDYIRLLVETGVVGITLYLVVLLLMGYKAVRNLFNSSDNFFEALSLAFIGVLVVNILTSAVDASVIASPVTQWYFWSYAAITHTINRLNRAQDSPSSRE